MPGPVPYNLKPKATKLPEGHDDTLDPPAPPTDAEARGVPPTDWPAVDQSKGSDKPPDPPAAPPAVSPAVRSVPASTWPRNPPEFIPGRPVHLAIPVPDLDPDIALWREVTVSIWPFTGAPTEGEWPKGWLGIDNTSTLWVCTVGGEPGTWAEITSGGGGGAFVPIANPTGETTGTQTPDSISGSDSAKWMQFPSDQSVIAWGLAGDSFPRVVFGAGSSGSTIDFVALGDGSFDPINSPGAYIQALFDSGGRGMLPFLFGGSTGIQGPVLGGLQNGAATVYINGSSPVGVLAGAPNDVCFAGSGFAEFNLWRCSTGGDAAAALWDQILVVRYSDPITAGVAAANPGVTWQDLSSSGSLWLSNGTSTGDWAQVWPIVNASGSASAVAVPDPGPGALLTTATLAVGTWKIDVTGYAELQATSAITVTVASGTATATYTGNTTQQPGNVDASGGSQIPFSLTFLALVTVAGTVVIEGATGTASQLVPHIGYTALKIA